jgi:hypothetical protein
MDDMDSIDAWQRYWRSGALHSLSLGAGNLDGALGQRWRDWFDGLEAGGVVADIACGNGPLARFALGLDGARRDPARIVHAVDIAAAEPAWVAGENAGVRAALRWHGGMALESLALPGPPVDAWVSQFGFEYADVARASSRLRALSAPRARLAMLVHHAGSLFVATGRREAEALDHLLGPAGLAVAARRLAPYVAERRSGRSWDASEQASADAARVAYNEAQRGLDRWLDERRAADTPETPDLPAVVDEFRVAVHRALGAEAPVGAVEAVVSAFTATRRRLATLAAAARDADAMAAWGADWREAGWRTSLATVHEGGALLGWWFEATNAG